jgi:hypothetical protein
VERLLTASVILLAISLLAFAYMFWQVYVTVSR